MPRDFITLADVREPKLTLVYEPCWRRRRYNVERLTETYGADVKLPDLRAMLADCPKARAFSVYDRCQPLVRAPGGDGEDEGERARDHRFDAECRRERPEDHQRAELGEGSANGGAQPLHRFTG